MEPMTIHFIGIPLFLIAAVLILRIRNISLDPCDGASVLALATVWEVVVIVCLIIGAVVGTGWLISRATGNHEPIGFE